MPELMKIILLSLMVSLASCDQKETDLSVAGTELSAGIVYRGDYCAETEPVIRLFSRYEDWNDWVEIAKSNSGTTEEFEDASDDIDFASDKVIIIAMGEQPSSGYSVDLSPAENAVVVREGILDIKSIWLTPTDNDVLAQVITSPCLALGISGLEASLVRITDESGEVVMQNYQE